MTYVIKNQEVVHDCLQWHKPAKHQQQVTHKTIILPLYHIWLEIQTVAVRDLRSRTENWDREILNTHSVKSQVLTRVVLWGWCARAVGSLDTWRPGRRNQVVCLCTGSEDAWTCSEPCSETWLQDKHKHQRHDNVWGLEPQQTQRYYTNTGLLNNKTINWRLIWIWL